MNERDALIRRARTQDAPALAQLINIAGEGIPLHLWREGGRTDEQAFAIGAQRAARDSGGFSYRNAHVAEIDGTVAAMLLGYRLPEPYDSGDIDEAPPVVRPLLELESRAAGSWYINAIATFEQYRGYGLGSRLLLLAQQLAQASAADSLSLIVASQNRGAVRLYQRQGYQAVATRPIVVFPGCAFSGNWLLMRRSSTT